MSPEPKTNRTLRAEDVRAEAAEVLRPLFVEPIDGYRASTAMLLDVLVYAAAEGTSLHGACTLLEGVADDTTLRDYLNTQFAAASADSLSRRGKKVVLSSVPRVVLEHQQRLAIDTKDFPYSVVPDFGFARPQACVHGQHRGGDMRPMGGLRARLRVNQSESGNY